MFRWVASNIVPFAPTVTTLAANPLTLTTALLDGAVGPNTAASLGLAYFEWGANTSFGNVTPPFVLPSFSQPASWSSTLSGLTPCQSYSYRAVATNTHGASFGATRSAHSSTLVITRQPLSQTAVEYHPIEFTVGVSALCGGSVTYQWYRNGTPIPGSNAVTLTVEDFNLNDNGSFYRVAISDSNSGVFSEEATLTVLRDTDAPVCLGVFGSFDLRHIVVRFSERVHPGEAELTLNYTVNGAEPHYAVLNPDGVSVTLEFLFELPDTLYTVDISSLIADWAGNGLSPTNVQFRFMPELNIARTANNRVVVSWLTNFMGYQLESKTNLVPGSWSPVAPLPVVVSGRNRVTNMVSGVSRFYRLRKP